MLALLEILVGWHHFYLGRSVGWCEAKNGFKKSILLKKIWKERFATSKTPSSSPNISCGSKQGKFRRKKGSKKRFGSVGCPGCPFETSGVPKHDSGAKIGPVWPLGKITQNWPQTSRFLMTSPSKLPFFLALAFKAISAIWRVSQLHQIGLILAEILFGAFRRHDRPLT